VFAPLLAHDPRRAPGLGSPRLPALLRRSAHLRRVTLFANPAKKQDCECANSCRCASQENCSCVGRTCACKTDTHSRASIAERLARTSHALDGFGFRANPDLASWTLKHKSPTSVCSRLSHFSPSAGRASIALQGKPRRVPSCAAMGRQSQSPWTLPSNSGPQSSSDGIALCDLPVSERAETIRRICATSSYVQCRELCFGMILSCCPDQPDGTLSKQQQQACNSWGQGFAWCQERAAGEEASDCWRMPCKKVDCSICCDIEHSENIDGMAAACAVGCYKALIGYWECVGACLLILGAFIEHRYRYCKTQCLNNCQ